MARICMLTIEHSPIDDRIFFKEATSLKEKGHEVHVLCKAGINGEMYDMGGKKVINPDGKTAIQIDGINIHGIPDNQSGLDKMLFKSFKDDFSKKFTQRALEIEADVYHAHEPASAYLGEKIKHKLKDSELIFDMHETWLGGGRKEWILKKLLLPKLRYMITANPITRGHLMKANPKLHASVIYNYPQKKFFNLNPEEKNYNKVVLAHDGLIPFNRGLKEMLETFRKVTEKIPDAKLKIIGETKGAEQAFFNNYIKQYGLEKSVQETGWVDYQKVPEMLSDATIGLIFKTSTTNNILGGPAIKLFNYFASSMGVFDVGLPESIRFMDMAKNGVSARNRHPQTLFEGMYKLASQPELVKKYGINAHRAFQSFMNWETEAEKLHFLYEYYLLNKSGIIIR